MQLEPPFTGQINIYSNGNHFRSLSKLSLTTCSFVFCTFTPFAAPLALSAGVSIFCSFSLDFAKAPSLFVELLGELVFSFFAIVGVDTRATFFSLVAPDRFFSLSRGNCFFAFLSSFLALSTFDFTTFVTHCGQASLNRFSTDDNFIAFEYFS